MRRRDDRYLVRKGNTQVPYEWDEENIPEWFKMYMYHFKKGEFKEAKKYLPELPDFLKKTEDSMGTEPSGASDD